MNRLVNKRIGTRLSANKQAADCTVAKLGILINKNVSRGQAISPSL